MLFGDYWEYNNFPRVMIIKRLAIPYADDTSG
jgi:hypothetical protein